MSATETALTAARDHRTAHGPDMIESFRRLLSLNNVTGDIRALETNAAELVKRVKARNAEMWTMSLPGVAPVVVGRLAAPEARRTIGMYVHYDGQPVDPATWVTHPFDPVIRHGRIYARGAAGDKAPFAAVLGAVDPLAAAGIDRHTELVFLFEGEEESGSPHLRDYMELMRDDLVVRRCISLGG